MRLVAEIVTSVYQHTITIKMLSPQDLLTPVTSSCMSGEIEMTGGTSTSKYLQLATVVPAEQVFEVVAPSDPETDSLPTYDGVLHSTPELPYENGQPRANDRESRNRAEKIRRNKLNSFINDLALLIPMVSESARKIDKTGVLRLAANDLRKEHVFGDTIKICHMEMRVSMACAFLDLMGGFMITVTCKGIITIVSPNVQNYLGHCQIDLLGQNIYNFIHKEDADTLLENICPTDLLNCQNSGDTDAYAALFAKRCDFQVRIMRASPRSEPPQYECCRIDGSLRRADRASPEGMRNEQIIRRQRVRRDRTITSSGNDVVFIGMVRVIKHTAITSRLLKSSHQEYWTRHLIDGRIVQCDQRISIVAGYMAEEITGVSAFTFMHKEDVRWVIIALRQMYDQSKQCGESCYRLLSRTGQFIYLKTRGFLDIEKTTKAVQSFVCVNSIVNQHEGLLLIDQMKRKYSAIVNIKHEDNLEDNAAAQAIEDPQQIEQMITHLVTNLPLTEGGNDSLDACEVNVGLASPAHSVVSGSGSEAGLTIIPPEPCDIRVAIAKSVNVISQARGVCSPEHELHADQIPKKRDINDIGCDNDCANIKRLKNEIAA